MKNPKPKTLNEIFELALSTHFNSKQFKASGYRNQVISLYKVTLANTLGPKNISDITVPNINKWHLAQKATPYQANRAKSLLNKLFSIATLYGHIPLAQNPCAFVPSFKEKSRRRYASEEEIEKIKELLEDAFYATPEAAIFIYLLLYTGARPSSIERARRKEFRVHQKTGVGAIIREGKTGTETIIVPPKAVEFLNRMPPPKDGSLVGCKMPAYLWRKITDEINAPDLWLRDLRRTFATTALSGGLGIDQIAEVLGHKSTQTTKIYAKLNSDKQVLTALTIADLI